MSRDSEETRMTPFTFIILALAAFRIQRIITTDDWPISEWFREKVRSRTGDDSGWTTLVSCAWCSGFHTSIAVVVEHRFLGVVPMWVYGIFAASAVVGMLGTYDS